MCTTFARHAISFPPVSWSRQGCNVGNGTTQQVSSICMAFFEGARKSLKSETANSAAHETVRVVSQPVSVAALCDPFVCSWALPDNQAWERITD